MGGWLQLLVVRLTQNLWKKRWLKLLLEKANTLNKKINPTVIGIKHGNLQREKCFLRNNYFLDYRNF